MYEIRISDHMADYSECDSVARVETREQAIIYLWALAKQDIPQCGAVWLPMGVEPMTNYSMFKADPPVSLKEKINKQIKELNGQSIEEITNQGLNLVFYGLGRYGDDQEFIDKVANAAREWAKECYQE